MTWPSAPSVHWCSFRRVSGSTRNSPALTTWIDKCRCGRIIQVEMRNAAGKITTTKTWFDKEGRRERVTGGDEPHQTTTTTSTPTTAKSNVDLGNPQTFTQEGTPNDAT